MDGTLAKGWQCVKFSMQDPQYYMYGYTASGTLGVKDETFGGTAQGDLDGNGSVSTFGLGGKIQEDTGGALVVTIAPNISEDKPDE
jgi:hypothetical protein